MLLGETGQYEHSPDGLLAHLHAEILFQKLYIVLFVLCNNASLATFWRAIRPNSFFLRPFTRRPPPMKPSGEDRTFNRSDGTHGQMFIHIQIN